MDLKRLRNFAVVAAAGSFHGAAEQLYIAQPALSRQMRSLEEELGVALFERSVRGVKLSSAGEVLLSELERLLPQLDLAMSRTQRAAKGQIGILKVAYTQIAAELSHRVRGSHSLGSEPLSHQLEPFAVISLRPVWLAGSIIRFRQRARFRSWFRRGNSCGNGGGRKVGARI